MATRTFAVDRDARVGTDGSLNLGAGACDHLPVGVGGGYTYYSFIKFDNDFSGMTNISAASLYLTNTDEYHLTRSGSFQFYLDRVTSSWSAGTASHPMTTANAVTWNGPSTATTRYYGPYTCNNSNNHQKQYDILELIWHWAPSTVYVAGYGYGQGDANYGARLIYATGDDVEFWSSNKGGSGNVPKIVVTYTNNTAPVAEITAPLDGSVVTGGTTYATPSITCTATYTDADGDAMTNMSFEFSTSAGFGALLLTSTANNLTRSVSSASLPRGTEIFMRARASDATGYGSYSSTVSFTINNATAPTITQSGAVTDSMEMTVEGADTGPRAVVRFTYADPEGQSMSRYTAGLYSDSGGTALLGTLVDVSTDTPPTYIKSDYTGLVHGTTYYWFVQTWDADGLSTGRVSMQRKARWAVMEEYVALTTATWSTSTVKSESTNTRAVVQHGIQTAGAAGTNPTNYNTDPSALSALTPTYYWAKYWLFAWHGAAIAGVSISSHSLTYTTDSLTADGWTLGGSGTYTAGLTATRSWYGTRSMKLSPGNGAAWAFLNVTGFKVGQTYTISGRILCSGAADAYIGLWDDGNSDWAAESTHLNASTAEFEHVYFSWVADRESIEFDCEADGADGSFALFDALKIEEGPVATPWTPSVLSRAVVVDGNGVQVDGRGGGVARFRGTSTATTDTYVDIGDLGLRFVSPATFKEITAPSTPPSGYVRVYAKSDGNIYQKDDVGTETSLAAGGTTPALSAVLAAGADANNVAISNVDFAAGSATAGSWPTLTSGTLQTTPSVGSIELDSNALYVTTDAGNRGVVPVQHIIRADSTRNLNSVGTEQALFNSPANGRITLETGVYMFDMMFSLTAMSATSGNAAIDPLGAGTAVCGSWLWQVVGGDNAAVTTVSTPSGQFVVTQQTAASAVTAGVATTMNVRAGGTFEVTTGGTFIPSVTLVTAAAATVGAGSYFMCYRVGSTTMASVGQWD